MYVQTLCRAARKITLTLLFLITPIVDFKFAAENEHTVDYRQQIASFMTQSM